MKKIWIVFLLTACYIDCYTQIKVTGTLIDSISKTPIQYSRITFGDPAIAVLSDENGKFEILSQTPNELEINNISFQPKIFTINANTDLGVVFCSPQVYSLQPFTCNPNNANLILGEFDENPFIRNKKDRYFVTSMIESSILSRYLDNPCKNQEKAYIEKINYYIIDPTNEGTPFRVQMYEAIHNSDGTISHGKPLIPDNIILSYPNFEGWINVDITKYGIVIPKNGLFVSIEFLKPYPFEIHKKKYPELSGVISSIIDDSNKYLRKTCLHVLFSRPSKTTSNWTYSYGKFLKKAVQFETFGDSNFWGRLNTGNPLIYINYSIQ
jgi:hypothetical protein